jgi:hypothetical protein
MNWALQGNMFLKLKAFRGDKSEAMYEISFSGGKPRKRRK